MRSLKFILLMFSLLSFIQSVFAQQPTRNIKKAERVIHKLIKRKKVPGLGITVLKNGELFYENGFGYANITSKTPVHPKKTIFRIASVSKPITAAALAKMVQEGLIDLDASVYKYVPEFPKKKYDFTIRQLGSHTAGFRSYKGKEYVLNKPYSIEEGLTVFKNDALLYKPGTNYLYNSYDFVLLSVAMQRAANKPFDEYVKEKVLEPLQMQNTFPDKADTLPNAATYYSKSKIKGFKPASPVNNYYKLAAGGYLSTTEDMAKLGQAFLNNVIASAEIMREFLTPPTINGTSTYYGIGLEVSLDNKNRPYFGHIGNGVGGYAILYIYPAQKMVIALATNVTNPKTDREFKKIINYLIEAANN